MCGCQSVESSQQSSLLRVVDASDNTPPVDLVVGADTEFTNISGPSVSNYAPVNTGTSTLTLRATGDTTGGAASSLDAKAGQEYSLLLLDQGSSYVSSILEDQSVSAPAGDVSLRFITDTPVAGALDIYLVPSGTKIAKATPVETDIVSGTVTAYVNLTAGTYDLITTETGATKANLTVTAMTLSAGQVRTLVFTDQRYTNPAGVRLTIGSDLN